MSNMNGYGVPEVFETEASGSLKTVYDDIKNVLKVPVVNFIFRTLAWYEQFLTIGWKQVRPNMLTFECARAADELRNPHLTMEIPDVDWSQYYPLKTIERIRATVAVFNYVNPKLLLIASAWAESLGNRPNIGGGNVKGMINPGIPEGAPPIELVHIPTAPSPIKQLLLDIASKHHVYDAASDFRALARYPQFLRLSWQHLREYVGSPDYTRIQNQLLAKSIQLTKTLPYRVTINRKDLEQHYSEKDIAGIMGVVAMFQHFLPGLINDGEYFRRILL